MGKWDNETSAYYSYDYPTFATESPLQQFYYDVTEGYLFTFTEEVQLFSMGEPYVELYRSYSNPKDLCKLGDYYFGCYQGSNRGNIGFCTYTRNANGVIDINSIDPLGTSTRPFTPGEPQSIFICEAVDSLSKSVRIMYCFNSPTLVNMGVRFENINQNIHDFPQLLISAQPIKIKKGTSEVDITGADLPQRENPSEDDPGDGNLNPTGDPIPFPDLPVIDIQSTGLITLYKPSSSDLSAFSSYLWSSDLYDTIKKMWDSPLENIISFMAVPYNPYTTASIPVKMGGVSIPNVTMPLIVNQFHELTCGSLNIEEYYGNFLDYGYTKMSLYLPYVGIVPINAEEVMGGTMTIRYVIDNLSTEGVCMVRVSRGDYNAVSLHYKCNVGYKIPLSMRDYSGMYSQVVNGVVGVGSSIATGGASGVVGALGSATANAVMGAKVHTQRSGGISANSGTMDIEYPYLIIERPIRSQTTDYKKFYGIPSNTTKRLSSLSGFTVVDRVISDGLHCHTDEKQEIMNYLTSGVIL